MKVFTRDSWAYWGDRIGVLVLISGSGAFLVIATLMIATEGHRDLNLAPMIGTALGGTMMLSGIWGFFQSWPTRLEIDTEEIRIFHRPTKRVTIARKDVLGAKSRAIPRGGSAFGIVYKNAKGKTCGVNLYGGWRDSNGKRQLPHSMTKVINAMLKTSPPPTP